MPHDHSHDQRPGFGQLTAGTSASETMQAFNGDGSNTVTLATEHEITDLYTGQRVNLDFEYGVVAQDGEEGWHFFLYRETAPGSGLYLACLGDWTPVEQTGFVLFVFVDEDPALTAFEGFPDDDGRPNPFAEEVDDDGSLNIDVSIFGVRHWNRPDPRLIH